jgi:hypothetical protein
MSFFSEVGAELNQAFKVNVFPDARRERANQMMAAAQKTAIEAAENNRNTAVTFRTASIAATVLGFAGYMIQPSSTMAHICIGGLLATVVTGAVAYMAENALITVRNMPVRRF